MNFLLEMHEIYHIALQFVVVGLVFVVILWKGPWERRSHVAQTIQAFLVIIALGLAGLEYIQHYQGDKDRKKQTVIDILRATMGSQVFGPAYHLPYDRPVDEILNMKIPDFDKNVASLSDIYWAVGACVAAGQCDPVVTRSVFCFDFKTYEFAYNVVHPRQDVRWQGFDDEKLDVFCDCPDKHRFSEGKLERHPEPWKRCSRRKGGEAAKVSAR